jgi:hypothetical protein
MKQEFDIEVLALIVVTGALIGLGQLLASTEKLTSRIVIGRMLSSGGLALCAASVLQYYPNIDPLALAGIAAVFASLGTSALERIISNFNPFKK